MGKLGSLIEP